MTWYSLTCTIIMVISSTLVKNGVSFSRLSSSKLLSYSIISLGFPSLFLFWQFLLSFSEEILFPISSTSFPWESISVTIKSWYLGKLVKVNIRLQLSASNSNHMKHYVTDLKIQNLSESRSIWRERVWEVHTPHQVR